MNKKTYEVLNVLRKKTNNNNNKKTMEVKYFKVKHKVLKNSLHVRIWSDFENLSLIVSGKT
jgi:hypothetical protein